MRPPRLITGLSEIARDYDALLCDAWGVIHNGVALFDGVAEALCNFREAETQAGDRPVFILTNAPRLNAVIPPQLDRLGLPRAAYHAVVTSGDATHAEVQRMAGKPAFRIGPSKDDTMFESLDIAFVALNEAHFIFCTGLNDDLTETPEEYRDLLIKATKRDLPFICANPDIIVEMGGRRLYCGGALAQLYETLGGEVIMAGKPYAPIYDLAFRRIADFNPTIERSRILAIGDGLGTDIKGANSQNIDVVFIADGIFRDDVGATSGRLSAGHLGESLAAHGCHAEYAMQRLVW